MTIQNFDKNIAKRHVDKKLIEQGKAPQFKIKTGGLVLGTKRGGYSESAPDRANQYLVSSNDSPSGMEWKNVDNKTIEYVLNDSKITTRNQNQAEVIILEGKSTASSSSGQRYHGGTATRYSHSIEHNISELRRNLISYSGMLSSADDSNWYAIGCL